MGLTRESSEVVMCYYRGWLSRLEMITCHTSIKTSILLMYFGNPYPEYQIHERTTTVVHNRTK